MEEKNVLADMMAFINLPGKPPTVEGGRPVADILHVTAAPPYNKVGNPLTLIETLNHIEAFRSELERQEFVIVRTSADLDKSGTKVILGLQNSPYFLNKRNFNSWYSYLYDAGIRIMQLWYKEDNELGGGFGYPLKRLTEEGYYVVRDLASTGIILDLSHAGHQTARDCVKLANQELEGILKVIASHTGVYDVFPHIRNLPSDVLRGIAKLGGIVGIYTLTFGLSNGRHPHDLDENKLENRFLPFLEHLEEAVKICGIDSVAIGTDGAYCTVDYEAMKENCLKMKNLLDPDGLFQARFPDQPVGSYCPRRLADMIMAVRTIGRQHNDTDGFSGLKKIMGNNVYRYLRKALPQS